FVTSEESLTLMGKEEGRTRSTKGTEAFFPPHHQSLFGPNSLLVQSGEAHDQLRRLIQPSLSLNLMTTVYEPIIDQAMNEFLNTLSTVEKTIDEDGYFELVPHLRSFFISIALQILLGKSSKVPPGLAEDLTTWSKGLLAAPLTFVPWSTAAKAMRARERIVATMTPLMEQARSSKGDDSLLGRLVSTVDEETGKQLSDQEIMDNVLTLVFAGSDTTASAATSMWLTLSLHPQLKETLKKGPQEVERFVDLVLQAYPPAPFSMRLTKQQLTVRDYDIPAGWLVVYGFAGALASKHDKNTCWETFASAASGEKDAVVSGSAAFGTGPRMCPGRYLAALELNTMCGKLVEKYDWKLREDQNLEQTYTPGFFPKDGLQIRLVS
ncbi:kaurenoic acid oxidase 1 (Partial), partial [Seminavis robusta]